MAWNGDIGDDPTQFERFVRTLYPDYPGCATRMHTTHSQSPRIGRDTQNTAYHIPLVSITDLAAGPIVRRVGPVIMQSSIHAHASVRRSAQGRRLHGPLQLPWNSSGHHRHSSVSFARSYLPACLGKCPGDGRQPALLDAAHGTPVQHLFLCTLFSPRSARHCGPSSRETSTARKPSRQQAWS